MAMIFQLGTNNWQRKMKGTEELEFAPGSGVLHEAHHNSMNEMAGVRSYSIYPSKNQAQPTDPNAQYRVFELDHDIPICESASPNSSKRWHTFSEEEFTAFKTRLENEVYDYMKQCEAKEGKKFTQVIAHHTFLNPLVMRNVIQRRVKEGLPKIPLYCFAHGTALKMYKWEIGGKDPVEFPNRFYKMIVAEKLFDDIENGVTACFVISADQKGVIAEVFPTFPQDRVIVAPNGININIFKPQSKSMSQVLVEQTRELMWPAAIPSEADMKKYTKVVAFVGKYAEWKRQAALLMAAAAYEKEYPDLITLCVGTGPEDEKKKIIDLCNKLGLKNTFLLGARSQPILAEIYTVANVCVFPSFKEPFGLVFVEAMACGAPVIGANSGGPKDFVSAPVGELVPEPPETTDLATVPKGFETLSKSLVEAITRSLKENWKVTKAAACKQLALDRFTVAAQVKFMLAQSKRLQETFWDIPGMKAGVITGDLAWNLLKFAKERGFAIPAFNCTTTSSVNAVLEAGKKLNRPIMVQFSEGGSCFFAGKSLPNDKKQASILGAVAGAHYTRAVASAYGIPVIVHSDHCAKKLLPWFDGMLEFDKAFFEQHGEPLFSSHMLDLSEEPHDENIGICAEYFKKMAPLNLILEMEIGITGGVEDGVDNSGVSKDKLYSTPDDLWQVHTALSPISEKFTVAAAFGNVHGVYKPGNVILKPELLNDFQKHVGGKLGVDKPFFFVFHGGSGSEKEKIDEAVSYGTVKMNVDTDTQWAYWEGVLDFYNMNEGYLQGQIGNPKGQDKPNKSYYDPRVWVRKAEEAMVKRVMESCSDLGNVNK